MQPRASTANVIPRRERYFVDIVGMGWSPFLLLNVTAIEPMDADGCPRFVVPWPRECHERLVSHASAGVSVGWPCRCAVLRTTDRFTLIEPSWMLALMVAAANKCEHVCGGERQVGNGPFSAVAKFKDTVEKLQRRRRRCFIEIERGQIEQSAPIRFVYGWEFVVLLYSGCAGARFRMG